jgi:predicted DNA-binding transcriptional regulator AlpA
MSRAPKKIARGTVLKMTGFDEAGLDKAIATGTFPAPVHIGKQERWLTMDVVDWLVDNVISAAYLKKRLDSKQ